MRGPWEFEEPVCAEVGPDIFFAEKNELEFMTKIQQAKQMCNLCLHKSECAEWANAKSEMFGIWGGQSAIERKRIRNGHKVA